MSAIATSIMGNGWPSNQTSYHSMSGLNKEYQGCMGLQLDYGRIGTFATDHRPPLRSYQSLPFTPSPAGTQLQYPDIPDQAMSTAIPREAKSTVVSQQQMYEVLDKVDQEVACGSSPPVSSVTQLSPQAEQDSITDDDDDTSLSADEQDEDLANGGISKTSAELRADKRKMKRFRLTHNQTRFLMSEFTRQAHPDAAQRERLSRDIPGLSPRQVQVWFQNRRAKLKRLTSDARELVIKSRTLPEDFDRTQALRCPFASKPGHPRSSLIPSPASYASRFEVGSCVPTLMNETTRRGLGEDGNRASPMNTNLTYGNFYTSTEPYTTSEGYSPISPFSERSDYANQFAAQTTNTRSSTSFPHSPSLTTYSTYALSARQNHSDPVSRARAASLATSLRTSMSYPELSLEYGENAASTSATQATSTQIEHHNGYTLDSMVASRPSGYPLGTQGFGSIVPTDNQPLATPFSSRTNQRSPHQLILPSTRTQQSHDIQGLQSAPLASPQNFRLPPQHNGFYSTSAENIGYDLVHVPQEHKFKKEASAEGLTMEAHMQSPYHLQTSTKQEQQQQIPHEGFPEEVQSSVIHPPQLYTVGRHRSFTLPMNYSTSR